MYYFLRYYKEQTQLVGLFFKKGFLEFAVKILDKYMCKDQWSMVFQLYFYNHILVTVAKERIK